MHLQVRRSRLLVILTAVVTAMTLVMPVGMARAATATVTAIAGQVLHRGSNTVTFNVANPGTDEATYTPTVTGPSQFTIGTADDVTVAAGANESFEVDVTVPDGTDPANFTLTAKIVSGSDTSTGTANLPLKLQAGQNRSQSVSGLAALNNPPSQAEASSIAKAFDGNNGTLYHSPWNGSYGPPNNIDIDLGGEIALASLEYQPRPAGNSNGNWNAYEIWAGNDVASLTQIAAGTMPDSAAAKTVGLTGNASVLRVRVLSSYGAGSEANKYITASEIRVRKVIADDAVPPLPVTLVGALPAQANLGAERMFDHDPLTHFHTPYSATQEFPYNIDLALGEDPVDLESFVLVPYVGTGAGADNGRPGKYALFGGNSSDAIDTELASGVWENTGAAKTVDLSTVDANFTFLRLAVGSTYGDLASPPQNDKYVAISELKVYGEAVPVVTEFLEVGMVRTDDLGDTVHPGDELTFEITYTNLTDQQIAAFPRASNLSGVLTGASPNCRYGKLPANGTAKCTTAKHVVTAADLEEGTFTPSVTFDATAEPEGTTVLQAGVVATAPAVTVEAAPLRPEGEYVALASAGDYGFTCHRIPALTTAPNGDLLAAWDGRPGGCGDAPQANSIIQRRSTDGGQTWGDVTTVAAGKPAAPKFGYSDPSYVVDRETGTIFNFFVKSFDEGWGGSQAGTDPDARNVIQAAVTKSTDNGATWSTPEVITAAITNDPAWTSRFAASGEGIQLKYAPYKGRLIQQFTIRNTAAGGNGMQAVSVYSDDHGATWKAGTPVGTGMDENKVVELSDGRVMLNSRPSSGPTARKLAISTDGGITYGDVTVDETLIDPRNNASIIRAYPDAPMNSAKAKVLLFSNAANTGGRSNGTVRVSFDDGQTWSGSKVFEPGSMSYSTLTPLPQEGTYGLFYEGANTQMRYMTISMDWLGVLPLSITAEAQSVNRGTNEVTFSAVNLGETAVTFTPTIAVPAGWTASAVAPVTIAAGATGTFTTTVTVPATADPGHVSLTATATVGGKSAIGTAALTMELKPGQNPTKAITVTPVNTPPAQANQGIDKAFDGDVDTLWHTPWGAVVELPVDVDMSLGDAPVEVAKLEYVPRQSGNNGRINGYEIWAGNSIDGLAKVAEGNFADNAATKTVPLTGTYQYLRLRTISSYGSEAAAVYVSAAEIRVKVAVPDTEALPLDVELANTLASQEGFGPEKMFDNDLNTWFHTPYAATQTFPYNIDLSLGDAGAHVTKFVMTPRPGDVKGDNNGRPGKYRILVGDSLDSLTEVKAGTWEDTSAVKTVELDATGKFVRLEVGSTYGDGAAQQNKYVAIAELDVFGTVVPPAPTYLDVSLERTDTVGTPVKVGDELTFKITYTNTSDRTIVAFPRESNLTDVKITDAKNCRWDGLGAGVTKECGFARHTVTAADLEAGSFTPSVTFDATADRDGTEVLQAGIVATLPAIEVKAAVDPTPSVTPTVTVTAPEVTATSTATQTATSTATQTATSTATATATATTTATVTSTATATSTNTVTATSTATATATTTTTATATVTAKPTTTATATVKPTTSTPTVKPTVTPTVKPTVEPTVKPTAKPTQRPVNVYTDPGYHTVNGRQWFTRCEPYSATTRCFTQIWASQVKTVNGKQQWVTGWTFNNLTYLPMDRDTWKGNKLAFTNEWTATDGRKWKTECDTAETGRNGCRSFIWSTVYEATSPGARTFHQVNKWVFNNIVMFS